MKDIESSLGPGRNGRGAAILCVDDEPRVLLALGRALVREPYDVLRAGSGSEALELLERFPIKVIITDERMPEMSGSELLSEAKRRWPWVGGIILTGYPGPSILIRSLEEGTNVLMSKPWDEEMLRRTIRSLIEEVEKGWKPRGEVPPEPWDDLGGEGG